MGIVRVAFMAACSAGGGHQDIHLEPDQFYGLLRQTLLPPLGVALHQREGLPFDVAKLPEPLQERLAGTWDHSADACAKITDPRHPLRRLRAGGQRPCSRRASKKRDELAPLHVSAENRSRPVRKA